MGTWFVPIRPLTNALIGLFNNPAILALAIGAASTRPCHVMLTSLKQISEPRTHKKALNRKHG